MPNRYERRVTRGAVRLSRRWEPDATSGPARRGGGTNAGRTGVSTAGRERTKFSARSRRAMRYEFSALPWEMLGQRPAMVTLTYPGNWREWAPDARAVKRHREAFKERWRRAYGPPVGVWVMEFQPRATRAIEERRAPHIHMYLGLPNEMSDGEFDGLVKRTLGRKRLERRHGKYAGRGQVSPPEGEFSEWLLRSWWEVVGSGQKAHRQRGADITPAFWTPEAEAEADRTRIAEYFWRESGKWGQKSPPEGFGGLRFYGRWGRDFEPVEGLAELPKPVYKQMRRLLVRLVDEKMKAEAKAEGRKHRRYKGPRGLDGLTLYTPNGIGLGRKVEEWAWGVAFPEGVVDG